MISLLCTQSEKKYASSILPVARLFIYSSIWLYLIYCIRVSIKLICTYSPLGGYMQKITKITHDVYESVSL